MEILVVRHAQAEDDSLSGRDEDRTLTDKGRIQSRDLGRHLKKINQVPQLILTSPRVRARDTAILLSEAAGSPPPLEEGALNCGARPKNIVDLLSNYQKFERVAIVGHQPDLGYLVEWWLGAGDGRIRVRKGSVIALHLNRSLQKAELQAILPWQWLISDPEV